MADRILTATYRLQLHKDFPLRAAADVVAYLHRLGISHAYTSPVLMARPGSTHGYDVADPTRLNPELGGEPERRAFVRTLHERGMGWLLDVVPNHMGTGPANPFWEDVLARGRESRYARWFDIDWDPPQRWLKNRVLLPVLGDELEKVLERGELKVDWSGEAPRLRYHDNSWPIDPTTVSPSAELSASGPPVPSAESLRTLLDRQHYALVSWKRAPREINYRRFFDVNELIALRMEDPQVFDETHARVLEWVEEGDVDGLRIDHVDGLRDPLGYLERLRERATWLPSRGGEAPLPIVVEKILSPGEQLRAEWPVQGTTGYEALNDIEALFVEPAGMAAVERVYRRLLRLRRGGPDFAEVALRGKALILHNALHADVARLTRLLTPVARRRLTTPPDRATLHRGVAELIACLPVYRTYVDGRGDAPHPDDRTWVEAAHRRASERALAPAPVLDLLADVFLRPERTSDSADDAAAREAWLTFVQRFQQTSGPATAKGVEDTALYQYVPLASRNEVGGDPERDLADSLERLHRANAERAERWPRALVCVNTHDTKRSADVRARIDVLSEIPDEWARALARWWRINRVHRPKVRGRREPDANTAYLLYQTIVGMWPMASGVGGGESAVGAGDSRLPTPDSLRSLRERLHAYVLKAAREAKLRTSWTEQNPEFEKAIDEWLKALLDPGRDEPFLRDVARLVGRIARPGMWNALTRVLVHLCAPGTPDIYQGDELWNFALVDPDNRRPVDYALRARLLDEIEARLDGAGARDPEARAALARELLEAAPDGRIKLYVMRQLLHARRADAPLFTRGRYQALTAVGPLSRHVVAFARHYGPRSAIAVGPRFTVALGGESRAPVGAGTWGETAIPVSSVWRGMHWTCALSGHTVKALPTAGGAELRLSEILATLPVALLTPIGTPDAGNPPNPGLERNTPQ